MFIKMFQSFIMSLVFLWVSHSSSLKCLGLSSSILLIKSPFSKQPSQVSSQSLRIFFKSRTLSFFKSTLFRSICFSVRNFTYFEISIQNFSVNFFYRKRNHELILRAKNLPYRSSHICLSFFFSFSQTFSLGIPQDKGLDISPKIPVAASAVPPK